MTHPQPHLQAAIRRDATEAEPPPHGCHLHLGLSVSCLPHSNCPSSSCPSLISPPATSFPLCLGDLSPASPSVLVIQLKKDIGTSSPSPEASLTLMLHGEKRLLPEGERQTQKVCVERIWSSPLTPQAVLTMRNPSPVSLSS